MFREGPRPQVNPDACAVTGGGPGASSPPSPLLSSLPGAAGESRCPLVLAKQLALGRFRVPTGAPRLRVQRAPLRQSGGRRTGASGHPAGVTPGSSFRSSRSSPATSGAGCSGRWRCSTSARDTGSAAAPGACPPRRAFREHPLCQALCWGMTCCWVVVRAGTEVGAASPWQVGVGGQPPLAWVCTGASASLTPVSPPTPGTF